MLWGSSKKAGNAGASVADKARVARAGRTFFARATEYVTRDLTLPAPNEPNMRGNIGRQDRRDGAVQNATVESEGFWVIIGGRRKGKREARCGIVEIPKGM